MAIELRKPGTAKATAQTGKEIGEAQKVAQQWEIQKAAIRSQTAFQQEQLAAQYEVEKEARARMWDIEKMELASRNDFMREERKRQMDLDEKDSKIKAIKQAVDAGQISKEKGEALVFSTQYETPFSTLYDERKEYMTPEEIRKAELVRGGLQGRAESVNPLDEFLQQELQGISGLLTTSNGEITAAELPVTQPGQVYVIDPSNQLGTVSTEDLDEYIAQGYSLVPGQNIPKSDTYLKYQNEYISSRIDELSSILEKNKSLLGGNPIKYLKAKQELLTLTKKYPEAFEQYLDTKGQK